MFPHLSCWSTLRTVFAIIVAASLLASTLLWSASVGAQGQSVEHRAGKPRRQKPEGTLPDLEEVQRESSHEREAPAAIPSTTRGRAISPRHDAPTCVGRRPAGRNDVMNDDFGPWDD